jgi:hypothetical protein
VHERSGRSTTTVLTGGAVLLVLALLAVAVISRGGHNKTTTRSPSGGKSQRAGKDARAAATLAPQDVMFSDVYGVQVPSSPAGPHRTQGGRALGFDDSPAGAVLAAIHIFARSESRPGPVVFEPTINEQVTGPDKDTLLANAKADYSQAATRGTSPDGALALAIEEGRPNHVALWAYRVDAYDDSSAAVNLLLRQLLPGTTSYAYFNFPFALRFLNGDWELVAPLNGKFSSVIQRVPEVPANYVVIGKD